MIELITITILAIIGAFLYHIGEKNGKNEEKDIKMDTLDKAKTARDRLRNDDAARSELRKKYTRK